jgi:hypothetical protein
MPLGTSLLKQRHDFFAWGFEVTYSISGCFSLDSCAYVRHLLL